MEERVCFYSEYDMSCGYHLELAEKVIQKNESTAPNDIVSIIELYHIKQLLDLNLPLKRWTTEEFDTLKQSTKDYNKIIAKFFNGIEPCNVISEYNKLDYIYQQTFWDIIDRFEIYRIINNDVCREIVSANPNSLRLILHNKGLTKKFKVVLKEIFIGHKYAPLILLDKYLSRNENPTNKELYLPSNLSIEDKENIIIKYLESDDPNLNYVRLIVHAKDCRKEFVLGVKTRLKAKKLAERLNDELMNDKSTSIIDIMVGVKFSDENNIDPVSFSEDSKGNIIHVYSKQFILGFNDIHHVEKLNAIFGWMDIRFCMLDLISKPYEADGLESIIMSSSMGRSSYPSFMHFNQKNQLALLQLMGYNDILQQSGSSVEEQLKNYYEDRLKQEYGYPSLQLNYPNLADLSLNKCRVLFPELDFIVKQYDTFVEEDEIELDYIRLSKPLAMTDGRSLLERKYYEIVEGENEVRCILNKMFSSGGGLAFVEPHKEKHFNSLFDLLSKESVEYANYKNYQRSEIDYLIEQEVLCITEQGCVVIADMNRILVLLYLWKHQACSYWHFNDDGRKILDEMLSKGWLKVNNNLLTTEEQRYFSYYLNNQEFTNGFAYRNHYAHGSMPPVDHENVHATAYLVLLRLLIILVLKMNDDLSLARRVLDLHLTKINDVKDI